jgi:leucine dehydrogenase
LRRKAVIMGDAKTQKTPELMRKFGEFVHGLRKIYYCRRCVGMETRDMDMLRRYPYVTGRRKRGSRKPSPVTAYGVYMGMKAAAKVNLDPISYW